MDKMKPIKITVTASGNKKAVNFKNTQKISKTAAKITPPVKKTMPAPVKKTMPAPVKKTMPAPTAAKSNAMIKNGMKMGKRAGVNNNGR